MKRKISFYLISILILYILPKPEYRELNSLGIVHSIHIQCIEEEYKIELEEIIPQKENNSIVFQYKKYRITEKEIQNTKKDLEKKYHKNEKISRGILIILFFLLISPLFIKLL